jgi:hypothetical protein
LDGDSGDSDSIALTVSGRRPDFKRAAAFVASFAAKEVNFSATPHDANER